MKPGHNGAGGSLAGNGAGAGAGSLAYTGIDATRLLGWSLLLIAAGFALMLRTRRLRVPARRR